MPDPKHARARSGLDLLSDPLAQLHKVVATAIWLCPQLHFVVSSEIAPRGSSWSSLWAVSLICSMDVTTLAECSRCEHLELHSHHCSVKRGPLWAYLACIGLRHHDWRVEMRPDTLAINTFKLLCRLFWVCHCGHWSLILIIFWGDCWKTSMRTH